MLDVDDNKVFVGEMGGINKIVEAMKFHPESAEVQEAACRVLRNLCVKNGQRKWTAMMTRSEENPAKLGKLGGIPAILRAMENHPQSAAVQEQGCIILRSLCKDGENIWMAR